MPSQNFKDESATARIIDMLAEKVAHEALLDAIIDGDEDAVKGLTAICVSFEENKASTYTAGPRSDRARFFAQRASIQGCDIPSYINQKRR